MTLDRRQFLLAAGGGTAGLSLARKAAGMLSSDQEPDPGWHPGIETIVNSACLVCPSRCGVRGRVVDGKLVRLDGNPLHPMSRGGVCPRAVASVQTLYHPDRIRAPLQRVDSRGSGTWRELSVDQAVEVLAERLARLRAAGESERVAVLAGYCAGSMDDVWQQFLRAYGSPNYVSDAYDDGMAAVMSAMHGHSRRPAYNLERAGLVLSFGAPLFEAWWSPVQAFVAFAGPSEERRLGPRFVQVDSRFSRTAAFAHRWVGVRPGTHAILALGLAYVLIREESVDADFLARHVTGYEDWTDASGARREGYRSLVLRHYRTEEVSTATGVPVERIVALAKSFADASPGLAVCGADVTQAPDGMLAGMAVHSLNVLTGAISRPGGVMFSDDPPLRPLVVPELDTTARRGLARTAIATPGPYGTSRPRRLAEALAAAGGAPLDVLMLYYANPLASASNADRWTMALRRVPFLVSFSPFMDETTSQADLVLPDLLPQERWQDAPTPSSYPYPTWAVARPLVEPVHAGRHTGDVVLALARRLGGSLAASLPYDSFEALLRDRAQGLFEAGRGMVMGDEFETRHWRQMEERGWWLAPAPDFETFYVALLENGGWTDPFYDDTDPARLSRHASGRIDLMPDSVRRRLELAGNAPALYRLIPPPPPAEGQAFPYRLIPYRVSTLASGTVNLMGWIVERPTPLTDVHWIPWVEVHPDTARAVGVEDGSLAWVESSRGRYRALVRTSHAAPHDVVNAPYGLRHPGGELANPLQLLDESVDPLTDLESWGTTFVRLRRA